MRFSVPGKVFARIIIDRVRHHLLEHQCPEQSGFTPNRSTIDHILALRVLTERRREFQQGLFVAYVDLCKALDSVNRDALWRILGLLGVSTKLINLMSELYSGTESAVRCSDTISDLFSVVTGVCHGCVLVPTRLSTCMDWSLERMLERSNCSASFGNVKISDLDFADDAVIFAETGYPFGGPRGAELGVEAAGITGFMGQNEDPDFDDILNAAILSVPVCGEDVEVTERFTYLGSDIHVSACCEPEINRRLGRAWGVMDSLDHVVWCCRYLCSETMSESLSPWHFQSCSMDVRLEL